MLLGWILGLLAVATAALLLQGLLGPREPWDLELGEGVLATLNRRKARLLRAMKDLEYERENGTLTEEEFQRLRNDFKLRALRVMKDLDRVRVARIRHLRAGPHTASPALRQRVEDLVKERKAAAG